MFQGRRAGKIMSTKVGESTIVWSHFSATATSTAYGVSILKTRMSGTEKNVLNILLNSKNEDCERNALYWRLREEFPITFRTIEDLKSKGHRNLSKQLHRFTSDAVATALLEVQHEGIAAIPHVDALICQEKHASAVCETLGKHVFLRTGACATVGGLRYSPLTETEKEALAFDETAPSDDSMSYDEWEALRLVKCAAALKLMRRCPPLFAPIALAAGRLI